MTIDVIAREGLEAATIRRIAAEVGYSTTAVTHYFADKRELLLWAYRFIAKEGDDRFDEVFARDPSDVIGVMLTMTAYCPANVRRWKSYLAFAEQAARDPELATEHRLGTQAGLTGIARALEARDDPAIDIDKASRLLNAIVQGISLQAIVDEQAWPPEKVRVALTEAVDMVLAGSRIPA